MRPEEQLHVTNDVAPSVGDALANLERSRARLWQHLTPPASANISAPTAKPGFSNRLSDWLHHHLPATAGKLVDSARSWWHGHPLHAPAELIGEQVHERLRAQVNRHPLVAVGLAATAGAAIGWLRPWRSTAFGNGVLRTRRLAGHLLWREIQRPATQAIIASSLLARLDPASKSSRRKETNDAELAAAEVDQTARPFAKGNPS